MVNKGIIAYAIIFVVIVVVSWFFLISPSRAHITTTTSIAGVNLSSTTTVIGGISTTTTNVTTTTINYGSCVSKAATVPIFNGNFSYGNYTGWMVNGYGFNDTQYKLHGPLNISLANANALNSSLRPNNATWRGYTGNFIATSYQGGLNLRVGNITSRNFLVTEPYLNFKVISPQSGELYVTILTNGQPYVTTFFNTYSFVDNQTQYPPATTFRNASIPLAGIICQNATIMVEAKVVGSAVNKLQYIAVGDFYMGKTAVATPGIVVNQTIG